MSKDKDLLDELHAIVDCEYLSQLKEEKTRYSLLQAVNEMNMTDFTFDEWSEAISYLFGVEISISQYEDIDIYIQKYCSDSKI